VPVFHVDEYFPVNARKDAGDMICDDLITTLQNSTHSTDIDGMARTSKSLKDSYILSEHNPASETIAGEDSSTETQVPVHWKRALLPFLTVLATIVFLVLTTMVESQGKQQQHKPSILPRSIIETEGRSAPKWASLRDNMDGVEIERTSLARGKILTTKLQQNERGRLIPRFPCDLVAFLDAQPAPTPSKSTSPE
jgi:hypothetical protein